MSRINKLIPRDEEVLANRRRGLKRRATRPQGLSFSQTREPRRRLEYGGCIVLLGHGLVLLQKRDADPRISNPGKIGTFGGLSDPGESVTNTAIRELCEEIGVIAQPHELNFLAFLERFDEERQAIIAHYFYTYTLRKGTPFTCHEGRATVVDIHRDIDALADLGPVTRDLLVRLRMMHLSGQVVQDRNHTPDAQLSTSAEEVSQYGYQQSAVEVKRTACADAHPVSVSASTSLGDKLLAIQSLLNYAAVESQIYWQRCTVFLAVNSGLFGFIAATFEKIDPLLIVASGLFGYRLNMAWIRMMKYSKFLAEKWREDARSIVRSNEALTSYFGSLVGAPKLPEPTIEKPSTSMFRLGKAFVAIWVATTFIALVSAVSLHHSRVEQDFAKALLWLDARMKAIQTETH